MKAYSISYKRAESDTELLEILALQHQNLATSISSSEKKKEGFVTVTHDLDLLSKMNAVCPHIIALAEGKVVGYALCMHTQFGQTIDVLKPMFAAINSKLPMRTNYMVMGQICIGKNYRKQGIFRGLYAFMEAELKSHYDQIVTEVDLANNRSMNAHQALGFQTLHEYKANHQNWLIIHKPI